MLACPVYSPVFPSSLSNLFTWMLVVINSASNMNFWYSRMAENKAIGRWGGSLECHHPSVTHILCSCLTHTSFYFQPLHKSNFYVPTWFGYVLQPSSGSQYHKDLSGVLYVSSGNIHTSAFYTTVTCYIVSLKLYRLKHMYRIKT